MTDWEAQYRDGDTPWDHGVGAPPLEELLEIRPRTIWGDRGILVPGCGRGHDAAMLARAGYRVLGLDLSGRAIEEARGLYGDLPGLEFAQGDLLDPAVRDGRTVSAVWEHTCFCALPVAARPGYVAAAADWLEPGGRLLGVFYLDPQVESGPPFGMERAELDTLFGDAFAVVWETRPGRIFESRAGGVELLVEMLRRP